MTQLLFVTSSSFKAEHASHLLRPFGINIERQSIDFVEVQADGETICRHKAEQAFAQLQRPLVVNDDSWSIPGLGGFPGAYMKDMNQWFKSEDWLRLTKPLQDRRIMLEQHIVYQDESRQQHFMVTVPGELLSEIRGAHTYGHLTITSFDGGQTSGAERVVTGKPAIEQQHTAWNELAAWLNQQ